MGKILIIKGADFSAVSAGHVDPIYIGKVITYSPSSLADTPFASTNTYKTYNLTNGFIYNHDNFGASPCKLTEINSLNYASGQGVLVVILNSSGIVTSETFVNLTGETTDVSGLNIEIPANHYIGLLGTAGTLEWKLNSGIPNEFNVGKLEIVDSASLQMTDNANEKRMLISVGIKMIVTE